MDQDLIATHLKKLDRRLARVEQILPTLATKEELQAAIAPPATKDDLKALAAATKDDLGELRRYMDVLTESLRGDIHLIAAPVASERSKHTGT
jgi:hypothetical protein